VLFGNKKGVCINVQSRTGKFAIIRGCSLECDKRACGGGKSGSELCYPRLNSNIYFNIEDSDGTVSASEVFGLCKVDFARTTYEGNVEKRRIQTDVGLRNSAAFSLGSRFLRRAVATGNYEDTLAPSFGWTTTLYFSTPKHCSVQHGTIQLLLS